MKNSSDLIIQERITRSIYFVRNQKVMMDSDLAEMYGVETKALNQAVKRNLDRFPEDFMFKLSNEEWKDLQARIEEQNEDHSLRSQIVTLKNDRGRHRKYLPNVFTE
ncbi:ORF6N domain-containing protein [Belliella sp. R4-6]|uniref:ORF6N domain-containing protein n=1 Tax=Belliella alkalica TaxID=1730871 RepID=A0ABS9VEZ5_9BACT|nr:ORF6N domain-containing protein [Belliella alkalica]MCH7414996.1 ORF6N domain-containing protein [Belliella alkalica]